METYIDLSGQDYDTEGIEEGEILDTEEEQILDRIKQLEDANLELEKIAKLSSDCTNQYRYTDYSSRTTTLIVRTNRIDEKDVARIPSDASLISSDEFEPIKKHTKQRKKRPSCKELFHKHSSKIKTSQRSKQRMYDYENQRYKSKRCHRKHNKLQARSSNAPVKFNDYFETISLDSDDQIYRKKSSSDSDTEKIDNTLYLNREKLRFALAHDKSDNKNKKTKNLLQELLCNSNSFEELNKKDINDLKLNQEPKIEEVIHIHAEEENLSNSERDEQISQEEQELRLIALKSAVLKKHLARKKRNAEVAYSPTDFESAHAQPKNTDDNMDVVEEELNELEDVMDISPINSPKLVLSPLNEETSSCNAFFPDVEYNNSVDMDIVSSENEEAHENERLTDENQWCPIFVPPMSTQEIFNNNQLEHPLPVHYGTYMPEMQYQIPEFYGEIDNEEPPPPPPFNMNILLQNDIKASRNNVFERLGEKTDEIENKNHTQFDAEPQLLPLSIPNETCDTNDRDSDEEASALRAVLLSRLNIAKNQKNRGKETNDTKLVQNESCIKKVEENVKTNSSIDSVLQKALRRLKSSNNNKSEYFSNTKENVSLDSGSLCKRFVHELEELNNTSTNSKAESEDENLSMNFEPNYFYDDSKSLNDSFDQKQPISDDIDSDTSYNENEVLLNDNLVKDFKNNIPQGFDCCALESETDAQLTITNIDASSNAVENVKHSTKEACINPDEMLKTLNNKLNKELVKPAEKETTALTIEKFRHNNVVKRKRSVSKTEISPAVRIQPLSVKNTLNQACVTIAKPAQIQQLQSPLKKIRRTTKIVRRNKIINKEVTTSIKRAAKFNSANLTTAQEPKNLIDGNDFNKNVQKVTTLENAMPKIVVKQLIINIGPSESDTCDEELGDDSLTAQNSIQQFKENEDIYSSIASPRELVIDSARSSPANALKNSSSKETNTTETPATKSTASVVFEQKLDNFLKNIRAKQTQRNIQKNAKHSPIKPPVNENSKILNTPVAVRHLPLSSQDEYRRLINRMKLLEKQKQAKKSESENRSNQTDTTKTPKNETEKDNQLSLLSSYENSFKQTSENIVALLNQSLSLVAEARKTKLTKLHHERRLKELRDEMDRLNAEVKKEDLKLNSMKPHLGESNQFLITLKKKRRDLLQTANKLGKTIKGDNYSLNNKSGEEIILKSRKLQAEIKLVNSMKPENFEQLLTKITATKNTEMQSRNQPQIVSTTVNDIVLDNDREKLVEKVQDSAENLSSVEKQCQINDDAQNEITKRLNNDITSSHLPVDDIEAAEETRLPERTEHQIPLEHNNVNILKNDDCHSDENVKQSIRTYISPLEHLRNTYGCLDFNAVVCPYEMWGKCADVLCKYMHITVGRETGTELVIKPLRIEYDFN